MARWAISDCSNKHICIYIAAINSYGVLQPRATQLVTGFVAKVEEMGGEIVAILISTGKSLGMEEMAT